MKFLDVLELVPDTFTPTQQDFIDMYKKSLEMLNSIRCNRYSAMYFGSMSIGPDFYSWNDFNEYLKKYQTCCIYIMNDLYSRLKKEQGELIELSISILYSMLAQFITTLDFNDEEIQNLIEINDKFELSEKFKSVFSNKEETNNA